MEPSPTAHLFEIHLETPEGPLHGKIAIPEGPMRLAELAYGALPLVDQLTRLATRREANQGRAISCRKGCGACCRQLVPLSPPEVWFLDDMLRAMPAERRGVLMERFKNVVDVLEASGFIDEFARRQETSEEVVVFA